MSSRFYPSLGSALWSGRITPEWLPWVDERAWQRCLTALHYLWQETGLQGVMLSSPVLWLPQDPTTPPKEDYWLFTGDWSPQVLFQTGQVVIPILSRDPLHREQFLFLMTPLFSAVAVAGQHPNTHQPGISLSFEPRILQRAWNALQLRVHQARPDCASRWDGLLERFPWAAPHQRLMARFSTLVMMATQDPLPPPAPPPRQLPAAIVIPVPSDPLEEEIPYSPYRSEEAESSDLLPETEFLRALAHEIRTPMASILTLVKLLLRRQDLGPDIRNYLEKIERECSEQIDRFQLIFQATEVNGQAVHLQKMPLRDLLAQHLRQWQSMVQRRGGTLELEIPEVLPDIVSDPQTLMRILQGVIERIVRSSPPGSRILAQLVTAGEQVKMQLQVIPPSPETAGLMDLAPPQPLGQLLIFQPDTGAISLSIPVTQALFRSLGGYLTVKHSPHQGETVTIYLPCRIS